MSQPTKAKIIGVFFATEMWERYGFYTIQALLALYLSTHLGFSDKNIYALGGSFTALCYIAPIAGGWIADTLIGQRYTTILGGIVLLLSYYFFAISHNESQLIYALSGICVGTGVFKPNISSMLGLQYKHDDPGRDSGFTWFYIGLSIGIILGTLLPVTLKSYIGWSYTFMTASAGLIFALIVFYIGCQKYKIKDNGKGQPFSWLKWGYAFITIAIALFVTAFLLRSTYFADRFFMSVAGLVVVFLIACAFSFEGKQRRKVFAFLLLCIISCVFWALYFQMFYSLTLFIHRLMADDLWGIPIKAPFYISAESIGLVIFGIPLAKYWQYLKRKKKSISTQSKFGLGLLFTAFGFGMVLLTAHIAEHHLVSPLFLFSAYLLISIGELLVSPIGLSMVAQLIPRNLNSIMMGVFFITLGLGAKASGWLSDFAAIPHNVTNIHQIADIYTHAFSIFSLLAIAATFLAFAMIPVVKFLVKE